MMKDDEETKALREAVSVLYHLPQGHSLHWDRKGTHGMNCPQCVRILVAHDRVRDLLKPFGGVPA